MRGVWQVQPQNGPGIHQPLQNSPHPELGRAAAMSKDTGQGSKGGDINDFTTITRLCYCPIMFRTTSKRKSKTPAVGGLRIVVR